MVRQDPKFNHRILEEPDVHYPDDEAIQMQQQPEPNNPNISPYVVRPFKPKIKKPTKSEITQMLLPKKFLNDYEERLRKQHKDN